jgi:hypothetical protein
MMSFSHHNSPIQEVTQRKLHKRYILPFAEHNVSGVQVLLAAAKKSLRPTFTENTPQILIDLISKCWEKEAKDRISCVDLLAAVRVSHIMMDDVIITCHFSLFPGNS